MRASLIFPTPGPVKLAKYAFLGGWGEGERIGDGGGGGGVIVVLFKPDKRSITLKFILLLFIAYNFTSYCFIMFFDILTVDVEFAYSYKGVRSANDV